MLALVRSKKGSGFETTTGARDGPSLSWRPPLVVVEVGAVSCPAVLGWEEVGEVNGRQDEHHGFQDFLVSPAGADSRDHGGSRWRGGTQSGGFRRCVVFWFGGGGEGEGAGVFFFREREGAGHTVFQGVQAQCFGFS